MGEGIRSGGVKWEEGVRLGGVKWERGIIIVAKELRA